MRPARAHPFVILAIADFTLDANPPRERIRDLPFFELEAGDVDGLMRRLAPKVVIPPTEGAAPGAPPLELEFHSMAELTAGAVADKCEAIARLRAVSSRLRFLATPLVSPGELPVPEPLLHDSATPWIEELQRIAGGVDAIAFREQSAELCARLLSTWDSGGRLGSLGDDELCDLLRRSIEQAIDDQLKALFAAPRLQQLLSTWHGFAHLASRARRHASEVRILVWDVRKKELARDLHRASEFDQSAMFRRIYEERLQTRGAEPVSLIVLDDAFEHDAADIETLNSISMIGAASGAPVIAPIGSRILGIPDWSRVHTVRNVTRATDSTHAELAKWRSLRTAADSSYLFLALPRLLAAWIPLEPDSSNDRGIPWRRDTRTGHEVWSNPSWFLAGWLLDAGASHFPCCVTEQADRIAIEGLPRVDIRDADGSLRRRGPTEAILRDFGSLDELLDFVHPRELCQLGLVPLCVAPNGTDVIVPALNSLQAPDLRGNAGDDSRSKLMGLLNYSLPLFRLAHAAIAWGRDHAGASEPTSLHDLLLLLRDLALDDADATASGHPGSPFSRVDVSLQPLPYRAQVLRVTIEVELGPRTADPGQILKITVSLPDIVGGWS